MAEKILSGAGRTRGLRPALAWGLAVAAVTALLLAGVPASRTATRRESPAKARAAATHDQSLGTRRMAEWLERLGENGDQEIAARIPNLALDPYLSEVASPLDPRSRTILDAQAAYEQLVAGNDRAAALQLLGFKDAALENGPLFGRAFVKIIRELLAISYLRAAEKRAPAAAREGDACTLMPSGGGRFAERDWAGAAITEYLEVLREDPTDLPVAAQPRLHERRRLPARRAAAVPDSAAGLQVGVRGRARRMCG